MNTVFFGTSDKSTPILKALKKEANLKLCITKSDTFVGRKKERRETAVKQWAKSENIPYVEIESLKKDKALVMSALKEHEIDLGVVADFSFIIPEEVLSTPKHGLINIHFSLLPKLRGASPVQHAILNRHELTGITFIIMDKGMDTGPILDQIPYPLQGDETTESLYADLFEIAAKEIPAVLKSYVSGGLSPQEQDENEATLTSSKTNPKSSLIDKNDAKIDWNAPHEDIEALIRAFYPWPISWTTVGDLEKGLDLKIKESVARKLRVKVYAAEIADGKLSVQKLQLEGKNIIDWENFKNGYLLT